MAEYATTRQDPAPVSLEWARLQRALSVEAERGFCDVQGNQFRFSEFLHLSLVQAQAIVNTAQEQSKYRAIAQRFESYAELPIPQRQHLVAETRRLLYQVQREQIRTEEAQTEKKVRQPAVKSPTKTDSSTPVAALDQSLMYLKGMGPHNADRLAKLGLYSVRDLLFYYPRDHIDYARQVKIEDLEPGETVTIVATVRRCNFFNSPKNPKLSIFELTVGDVTGQIKLSRFYAGDRFRNKGWQEKQKQQFVSGAVVAASGLVKENKYGLTLEEPEIEVLEHTRDSIDSFKIGRVVPIYPLTEGVPPDLVRRAVVAAIPTAKQLEDPLPDELRSQYNLVTLPEAIAYIHFPETAEWLDRARRRLVFDEFFYLQLGMLKRRMEQRKVQRSVPLNPRGELIDRFYGVIPFQFTGAQQRVVQDILGDLQNTAPMNRLVQGDVGSGKTVVAVVALLSAIQSGYQTAMMAPTEVLAEQHYRKMVEWFTQLHLPVELLTGSTKAAKRKQIALQLQTGELPLLVGTHALIQDSVEFQRLGLVVIDEQHRFGVQQRALLQQKGQHPHVLTMTATPIPRTLALTLHGDLDVSQIDELPPGRQAIQTTMLTPRDRTHGYDLIRREVALGRQVYVVLPLVEESEKLDLRSAVEEHQHLQESIFPNFQVGLLHGRMSSAEKDDVINQFRRAELQILVSTTVIEVGVDIPNATVMLIEHAERFGLAQLHQLRGRVGRGAHQSYCLLMNSSKTEAARQRLTVLVQSQDGFFISEMDMRFRGPGEVLGTRQSGLPDFALASLVEDQDCLELAREAAERTIKQDPLLDGWPLMQKELEYRYQRLMGGTILT
jgi:ATP-dependent DNA helicase RecG